MVVSTAGFGAFGSKSISHYNMIKVYPVLKHLSSYFVTVAEFELQCLLLDKFIDMRIVFL